MSKPGILIIDDDQSLRKTLSDILRFKGYNPFSAASGAEGLAFLSDNPVNIVLIDLGLPDMPGIDILNRVKANFPKTDAIILTGNATLDSAIAATNQGAFSYLLKPYDIEQLIININRAMEKQQAQEKITMHSAEVERANAELKTLNEISSAVSRAIDMDTLISEVIDALASMKIFPFEIKGAFFLVEKGMLKRKAVINILETDMEACTFISQGECLCGLAMSTGQIIVSNNSVEDKRHIIKNPAIAPHGHVIVPLKVNEKVVGILCLITPTNLEHSEKLLDFFSTVGNQIGMGINNAHLYEETKASSLHDPLTGLANRRFMEIQLEKSIETTKRYGESFSVIMIDIDYFKKYNDTYGHQDGDKLLIKLAGILQREMRNSDYVFRYGGEEFLIILNQTDLSVACNVAERLRKTVENETGATISLGVSSCHEIMEAKEMLIGMADAALYRAKKGGRNKVEAARDET